MNKKILHAKAMFMILLILTLPIYISNVSAANDLVVRKYSGNDEANGFFKTYDRWIIEADAKIDNDTEITPSQVKINNYPFQYCVLGVSGYTTCSYLSTSYSITPGVYPANISLYADNGTMLNSTVKQMVVDNIAPIVEFLSDPYQAGQKIVVNYRIKDRAYDSNDPLTCSGIKKVEFFSESAKLDERSISTSNCSYEGQANISLPSSDRIIIKAYDLLDQLSAGLSNPIRGLDNINPEIVPESFKITREGAEIGSYITGQPFDAVVSVIVRENAIDKSGVKADFSGLGGSANVSADSCTQSGYDNTCTWNVPVSIISSQAVSIVITATDVSGNQDIETISKTFTVDSTPPVVSYIGAKDSFEGASYLGAVPSDIIVRLSETGSGISNSNVMLDLSDVNPAYGSRSTADECNQTGAEYVCRWVGRVSTKAHGASARILLLDARDNSGNTATGLSQAVLGIDKKNPVINGTLLTAFGDMDRPIGLAVSNDQVIVTVNGTEDSPVTAFGDFSGIYNKIGAEKLEATCELNGAEFICAFDIPSVMSGYIKTKIPVTVVDAAGNSKSANVDIEIFAKNNEEKPNYWSVASVSISPSQLDRQTTQLIRPRVYALVTLQGISGAETAQIKLGDCSGDAGYINDKSIFYNQRKSKTPYLALELKNFNSNNISSLNISCNLEIVSVYKRRLSVLEIEPVNISIPMYNNGLGEPSAELAAKINDLKETYTKGLFKLIGQVKDLWQILSTLCNLVITLYTVVATIGTITNILSTIGTSVSWWPPAEKGVKASATATCTGAQAGWKGADEIYSYIRPVCNFINCQTDWQKWMRGWVDYITTAGLGNYISSSNPLEKGLSAGIPPGSYLNPKDNFLVALTSVCIPGIIGNLDKYRQIQCQYIVCLQNGVNTGVPPDACDKLKSYEVCKYFVGELFQLIPFVALFDYIINALKNAISDPFAAAGLALGVLCTLLCWDVFVGNGAIHAACFWGKILNTIGDVISQISSIIDKSAWQPTANYCEQVT